MRDSLVGLQAGVDARKWARLLRRAHNAAILGGHVPSIVRGVIADSWARCTETGVDPSEPGAPLVHEQAETRDRWREHPLSPMTEILRHVLGDLLFEARHIVVVSDADGCLLWADGHPDVLTAAERIRFWPGHAWSEPAAGTNAVGTALAADSAVQVFSAEHYRSEVHSWQCSGAPVHDPETGTTLGAIDVTGRYETAHPHNLALVQLAARLVEEQLRAEMLERDTRILGLFADHTARHGGPAAALSRSGRVLAATPNGWTAGRLDVAPDATETQLGDGTSAQVHPLGEGTLILPAGGRPPGARPTALRVSLLGRERAELTGPTGRRRLTVRHSELVALLLLHPDGLGARPLAELVYDEPGHEVAVRAELHRLRAILGDALVPRPYRLVGLASDLTAVQGSPGRAQPRGGRPQLRRAAAPWFAGAGDSGGSGAAGAGRPAGGQRPRGHSPERWRARVDPVRLAAVVGAGLVLTLTGAGSAGARTVLVGRSVQGRAITARVIGPDHARRKVLLVGCIHGNECAGLRIISAVARARAHSGVQLWLIGELNPDGTAAGTRQNAHGVDLNRNFPYQWRRVSDPTYYSGPHPGSERETRAAMRLIAKLHPTVTIWYHQHQDLVDMAGGDRGIARRYAQLSGLAATCLPFLPGTAPGWENHEFPGTTSLVVELPAGPVGPEATAAHVRAVQAMERGQRSGSRTSCVP
ncbi:MAG: M14 family zinc carboxypeptidase [Solirubrobacteraceae bacterium]